MRPQTAPRALVLLLIAACSPTAPKDGPAADATTPDPQADDGTSDGGDEGTAGDEGTTDEDGDTGELPAETLTPAALTPGAPTQLPIHPSNLSAAEDRLVLATVNGVVELVEGEWQSLDGGTLGPISQVAVYDGVLVASGAGRAWQHDPATGSFSPIEGLEGGISLERGLAGVYASSGFDAWKLLPERVYLGDSGGVVAASCTTQVEDGELRIYSQDIDDWVELPLPPDVAQIFEFAARGEHDRWVFGDEAVHFTQDGGESWRTTSGLTGLRFTDVRRDGDTLISVMPNQLAWSEDGGQSWQTLDHLGVAYTARDIVDGRAVLVEAFYDQPPALSTLALEAGASPEPLPALPPQVLGPAVAMADHQVMLVASEGIFEVGENRQDCRLCRINALRELRAASVNGGDDEGLWVAHGDAPRRYSYTETSSWTGGTAEGWPTIGAHRYLVATGLAPTPDGIAACTGDTAPSSTSALRVGAGVYAQTAEDRVWRPVGTDFPASAADARHRASCSALFQSGARLYAVAEGQTLALDDGGAWVPVAGVEEVADVVATDDGVWALVDGAVAWSADGWSFGRPDPRTAGTTDLDVLDGRLLAVQDGTILLGSPGERERVDGLEDTDVISIFVRDQRILATTLDQQLLWVE